MKLLLLGLLPLLSYFPAAGPAPVRVTFSPLTKAAYLAAMKSVVVTKPAMTFPVRKVRGRIVIPTASGNKIFQDKGVGTDETAQEKYEYRGYLPQLSYHLIFVQFWEGSQWILLNTKGRQTELAGEPIFSPDMQHIAASWPGIEVSGEGPNIIQLLALQNGTLREVWSIEPAIEPMTWEPDEIQWLSNSTLLLKKKMWTGPKPGNTFTYSKLEIK
ncbi:MAG: hypothetical protein M3Y54_03455 [Bacteroidota bacterium]|nr:hypothetical protein [Bacteroidota bacterium]